MEQEDATTTTTTTTTITTTVALLRDLARYARSKAQRHELQQSLLAEIQNSSHDVRQVLIDCAQGMYVRAFVPACKLCGSFVCV